MRRLAYWGVVASILSCAGTHDRDQDGILDKGDECPMSAEDRDSFQDEDGCPDLDNDKDGIPDSKDQCPLDAEDRDGFQDVDGCPDIDNDTDGILDLSDKCPFEKEDRDSFQDEDGCPDLDNDHDGIQDAYDQCPMDKEDKDGFEDTDGCPDVDNDKDGLLDSVDRCPHEAETMNGLDDQDGCPDARIDPLPDVLELPIQFDEGRTQLLPSDKELLKSRLLPGLLAFPTDKIYIYMFMPFEGNDTTSYLNSLNQRTQSIDQCLQAMGVPSYQIRKRTVTMELFLSQIGSDLDFNSRRSVMFKRKTQ